MGNLFIVVDGIDGSGKSIVVNKIIEYLNSKDKFEILKTKEPTDRSFGKKIRQMLENEKNPNSNKEKILDLFIEDRKDHLDNIILPFLKKLDSKTKVVVSDRYYYSTIAFQKSQGIDKNVLIEKNSNFKKPDLTLILDLDPEIALSRIEKRNSGEKEKFETLEFLKKVRENFLELKELLDDNIKIIPSENSEEEVFKIVKSEIDKLI